jgi:hypothetical protein
VALDEHHAHDMLFVSRDEHCVLSHEDTNLRFIRDLSKPHRLENDGTPFVVADPRRLHPRLSLFRREVEDRHDSVVSKYAFNSA